MPEIPDGVYDPVVFPPEDVDIFGQTLRGIPEPMETIPSIQATTSALKEVVETLLGLRGDGSSTLVEYIVGLWDQHNRLSPPYYNDPHAQYWHKILDPGWAHMHFENWATPKVVAEGSPVDGYDEDVVPAYQLVSDTATGTIEVTSAGLGVYSLSLSGFVGGTSNTTYVLSLYSDGVATGIRMPVVLAGTVDSTSIGWNGVIAAATARTLQIRLESTDPAGRSLSIYTLSWSIHRIAPTEGTVRPGAQTSGSGFPTPKPIPPGWENG